MKKLIYFIALMPLLSVQAQSESSPGSSLYADVQQYVAFGEHRTGTPADTATSAWIKQRLEADGFKTSYVSFPIRQFFPEKSYVKIGMHIQLDAFPLWHIEKSAYDVKGILTDDQSQGSFADRIVLTRIPPGGQTNAQIIAQLSAIIKKGAKAIVAVTQNETGELVAYNALDNQPPWKIPVVLLAPKDTTALLQAIQQQQQVEINVKGVIKSIQARNVLGRIGTGSNYVVISTPISGWFTCGGERGPGVAVFLALAKWVSDKKLPYTFLFTANTGHELDNHGAHIFLNHYAPKPDSVKLWVHLGAAVATLGYQQTNEAVKQLPVADDKRNIMYSENLDSLVHIAFNNEPGKRWKVKEKAVGELEVVANHGYTTYLGIAQGFRYHHTRKDDASTTSPEILESITRALEKLLEGYLNDK